RQARSCEQPSLARWAKGRIPAARSRHCERVVARAADDPLVAGRDPHDARGARTRTLIRVLDHRAVAVRAEAYEHLAAATRRAWHERRVVVYVAGEYHVAGADLAHTCIHRRGCGFFGDASTCTEPAPFPYVAI